MWISFMVASSTLRQRRESVLASTNSHHECELAIESDQSASSENTRQTTTLTPSGCPVLADCGDQKDQDTAGSTLLKTQITNDALLLAEVTECVNDMIVTISSAERFATILLEEIMTDFRPDFLKASSNDKVEISQLQNQEVTVSKECGEIQLSDETSLTDASDCISDVIDNVISDKEKATVISTEDQQVTTQKKCEETELIDETLLADVTDCVNDIINAISSNEKFTINCPESLALPKEIEKNDKESVLQTTSDATTEASELQNQAFTTSNQYGQTSQAETSNDVSAELIGEYVNDVDRAISSSNNVEVTQLKETNGDIGRTAFGSHLDVTIVDHQLQSNEDHIDDDNVGHLPENILDKKQKGKRSKLRRCIACLFPCSPWRRRRH
ncbi:uncharacterized protein LOC143460223 [Clavelina lepadiformis]|uniref:uncharacterized protein LOC143460223 n=1 Tax=Clavelina lepadiformis TaxID=159417 RepID=UPI004041B473